MYRSGAKGLFTVVQVDDSMNDSQKEGHVGQSFNLLSPSCLDTLKHSRHFPDFDKTGRHARRLLLLLSLAAQIRITYSPDLSHICFILTEICDQPWRSSVSALRSEYSHALSLRYQPGSAPRRSSCIKRVIGGGLLARLKDVLSRDINRVIISLYSLLSHLITFLQSQPPTSSLSSHLLCLPKLPDSGFKWPARASSFSHKGLAMVSSWALVSSSRASCGVFHGCRIDTLDTTRRRAKSSILPQEV